METRASKRRRMELEIGESSTEATEATIMQLNYDCLRKILEYLNIRDLINVEDFSPMFKTVTDDLYKIQKVLAFDMLIDWKARGPHQIEEAEAEKIFRRVGPYVETLYFNGQRIKTKSNHANLLNFVWKFCKNLQTLSLTSFTFNKSICTKLSTAFGNVKDVDLDGCPEVTDAHLQVMFNLQHVTKLRLWNAEVDGSFLAHLRDIKKIHLVSCRPLKPQKLLNFVKVNTQLTFLDMNGCPEINGACLKAISRHLVNLENLGIGLKYKNAPLGCYLPLMDLPKLKGLMLECFYTDNIDPLLVRVAAHDRLECLALILNHSIVSPVASAAIASLTKLQKLTFVDTPSCIYHTALYMQCGETLQDLIINGTKLTTEGLTEVIKKCKKIRYIDATYCSYIEPKFIGKIKKCLAGRHHKLVIDLRQSSVVKKDVKSSYDPEKLELIF